MADDAADGQRYYNPLMNEIVFRRLQPAFFDAVADPAVNYRHRRGDWP
jgi:predicted metalloendopeptidase